MLSNIRESRLNMGEGGITKILQSNLAKRFIKFENILNLKKLLSSCINIYYESSLKITAKSAKRFKSQKSVKKWFYFRKMALRRVHLVCSTSHRFYIPFLPQSRQFVQLLGCRTNETLIISTSRLSDISKVRNPISSTIYSICQFIQFVSLLGCRKKRTNGTKRASL